MEIQEIQYRNRKADYVSYSQSFSVDIVGENENV